MSAVLASFEPFDTFWFREGRPFEQTDDGLSDARSVFPPSPAALSGALAATLARALIAGRDPVGEDWRQAEPDSVLDRLAGLAGLDPKGSRPLRVSGPFLYDTYFEELKVPAPATLVIHKDADGATGRRSDFGVLSPRRGLRLPADAWTAFPLPLADDGRAEDYDALDEAWISRSVLLDHLADEIGRSHISITRRASFLLDEPRIGIGMERDTRTAASGELYASRHLRPVEDATVRLCVVLEGADEVMLQALENSPAQLGGRGRTARIAIHRGEFRLGLEGTDHTTGWRVERGRIAFSLTALSPVPVDPSRDAGLPMPEAHGEIFGALKVETAIIPRRPAAAGSWAPSGRGGPVLRHVHPPGSIWFVTLPEDALGEMPELPIIEAVAQARFAPAGLGRMGFGQLAAGKWSTYEDMQARGAKRGW